VRRVRQDKTGGGIAGYKNMVKEEDYIKVNKGQCVFTSVLLINS
jgi:hypothetical protein